MVPKWLQAGFVGTDVATRGSKVVSRDLKRPQDGFKRLEDCSKIARRGPRMAPRWPQDGPERPQDGPNMAPRRLQNTRRPRIRKSAENIVFYSANATSRQCHKEQKGTKMAPRDPNMTTKSPKEASAWPEVAGRCPKNGSTRILRSFLRVEGDIRASKRKGPQLGPFSADPRTTIYLPRHV